MADQNTRPVPLPQCKAELVGWQWRHREAHQGAPWSRWKHVKEPIEEFLDLFESQMQGNPDKAAAEVRPVFATSPSCSDAESTDQAWRELVEKDDRTSPEEYPEMCLITREELAEFMSRSTIVPSPSEAGREAIAHALNEWADLGSNATQWLKNIRDGISTVEEALAEMSSNFDRVLILSRAALSPDPGTVAVASEGKST